MGFDLDVVVGHLCLPNDCGRVNESTICCHTRAKKDLPTFDFTELEKILLAEDSQAAIEEQLTIHGEGGQDRLFCDYVNCGCGIWLCPIWCWGRNTCVL